MIYFPILKEEMIICNAYYKEPQMIETFFKHSCLSHSIEALDESIVHLTIECC